MTPELARYIRVARKHIYGTSFDEEAEWEPVGLYHFKNFLARRLELEVRMDLFAETVCQWNPDSCSLQFKVDKQRFLLQQVGERYEVFRRTQGRNAPLMTLVDNEEFQDRLLIAIDDALQENRKA